MNDFFNALLADLRDRRILPLVALLGVALLGAVAYAALGGGSGGGGPATSAAVAPPASRGLAVTQTAPETADAETTSGAAEQRTGHSRDPFKLLPGAGKQEGSASSQSTGASASAGSGSTESGAGGSGSGSGGSGEGKGEEEAKPTTKPKKPSKPKSLYHVAVLFGVIPPGTPPLVAELPPLQNIKLFTPLPSTGQPLIVFRGVTAGGRSATFSLVGEAILHGQAACLPNATQCQAIDLPKERYEQFETLAPSGEVVTYELRVVSITSSRASTASVHRLLSEQSKAGRALLRAAGMLAIPLLRVSTQPGVLVFAPAPHTARARTARREHRR
jgi:hypothetical protein